MTRQYHKLVRDRIPEIIRQDGESPITRRASDDEYRELLFEKLDEEVGEFRESGEVEELADVLEVIDAICEFEGVPETDLRESQERKAEKRGRFTDRIVLEAVRP